MPHISWPLRFVLPWHPGMRFASQTPTSKLLSRVMPWMKGRRPAWLIRLGLFLYDNLGGREILKGTRTLDLRRDPAGQPLKPEFKTAFEYSDCWVEDSRLVVLNARDADARGATIWPRTRVVSAERADGLWHVGLAARDGSGARWTVRARALVNAGGPWVGDVIGSVARIPSRERVRLVRGSHIVTRKLFDHDKAYFFQGTDGRIIFAIPYERDFTLIGTTDKEHTGPAAEAACTEAERDYLLDFASGYFAQPVTADDVVWTYSGVRPLYDDGATSATAATRDYVLSLDTDGPVLLNVFGGKITTYRRLAEGAMDKLRAAFPHVPGSWTARVPLPGGDFPVHGVEDQIAALRRAYPFLDAVWARRLVRAYGTDAATLLGEARTPADLGEAFGATLTAAEVAWLMDREYARTAEDVLWRRTKLGLRLDKTAADRLNTWMAARQNAAPQRAAAG
jgi:glycerol-3-phosphate dehydrogenase